MLRFGEDGTLHVLTRIGIGASIGAIPILRIAVVSVQKALFMSSLSGHR